MEPGRTKVSAGRVPPIGRSATLTLVVLGCLVAGLAPLRASAEPEKDSGRLELIQLAGREQARERLDEVTADAVRETLNQKNTVVFVCIDDPKSCAEQEKKAQEGVKGGVLLAIDIPPAEVLGDEQQAQPEIQSLRVDRKIPSPTPEQIARWKKWISIIKWSRALSSGGSSAITTGLATGSLFQGGMAFIISGGWGWWQNAALRKINAWLRTHSWFGTDFENDPARGTRSLEKKALMSLLNNVLLQAGEVAASAAEYMTTGNPKAIAAMAEALAFRSVTDNPATEAVRGAGVSSLTQTSISTINGLLTENAIKNDRPREQYYLLLSTLEATVRSMGMVMLGAFNRRPGMLGQIGFWGGIAVGAAGAIAQYHFDPKFRQSVKSLPKKTKDTAIAAARGSVRTVQSIPTWPVRTKHAIVTLGQGSCDALLSFVGRARNRPVLEPPTLTPASQPE